MRKGGVMRIIKTIAVLAIALWALPALAQFQPGAPPIAAKPPGAPAAPAAGAPASQALPVPVIAIVDLDRIMQESVAYQKAASQIEKMRQHTGDELRQRENELRDAEAELGRQQRLVTAEVFEQKRREFQKQVSDAQQLAQIKKRELDTASNSAIGQLKNAIAQIVSEVARERGANLVLPRAAVVLESAGFDVSGEVVERVNQKVPSVTVATTTAKPATQPQQKPAAQGQAPKKK